MRVVKIVAALAAIPLQLSAQVATVQVTPAESHIIAGQTVTLSALARDVAGNEAHPNQMVWFAVPFDVGAVDQQGNVSTFRQGQLQVFALADGKPGRAVVNVGPKPPADISLSAAPDEVVIGGTSVITPRITNEDGEDIPNASVTFRSSNERVATVDPTGVVTGHLEGNARIIVTTGNNRAEIEVRVIPNPVASLSVSGPPTASTGDVVYYSVRGADSRGRAVADPPVRWSVSGPGAAVYDDGGFVAGQAGAYLVTATVGNVAASASVAVSPRVHERKVEQVAFESFGDVQAGELWAIGDFLYMSTVSDRAYSFDISDPAKPVKVDSVIVDAQFINDISTTADGKIGVLTREGASSRRNGIVFLDLSDPLHPKILSEYTETVTGGVHSAYVDGHYVYLTDDATGSLRVIDFEDAHNPREVARWDVGEGHGVDPVMGISVGQYLHDVQVKDGLAYLAYWRHGLVILDVGAGIRGGSPENPQFVSQFAYNVGDFYPPEMLAGTHAVFRYKNYVFLGDEVFPGMPDIFGRERIKSLGRVHVIDVTDIEHPRKVAEYNVRGMGSHNMWVEDDVMYIGYYEGGLRVVDVSGELRGDLMAQGREIGALWTGSSEGFRPNLPMAWGARPYKGMIYVNDMNSGLWVARLTSVPTP